MIRTIHILKVNFPGGVIPSGELLSLAEAALATGVRGLRFGGRQQLFAEVYSDHLTQMKDILARLGLFFEVNRDDYPNIVSSCVADQVVYSGAWLKEGVYKDILDSFDFRPRLAINLVDQGQNFTPFHTGRLNFVASEIGNYWHLLWRISPEGRLHEWKSLVYSGNIARLAKRLEGFLLDTTIRDEHIIYREIQQSEQWVEQVPREPLSFPDFAVPYYEGFNRYREDRLWLGIYRRDELFPPAFLIDLCALCISTKLAQLYTTPWKSLIIQGVAPSGRKQWDIILGRHGINVRHSLGELSWQLEDISDEGLSLKHYLVRQFDRDDLRTFGLCFGIQLEQAAHLFNLVLIRRQPSRKHLQPKALDRYDILYRKDFSIRSEEYILYRADVQKADLAPYLKALCHYFYACKAGGEQVLHHVYRQKEKSPEVGVTEASPSTVFQCSLCLSIYDQRIGDPGAQVPPGMDFRELDAYACPLCGADKSRFKSVNEKDDGILCL